MNHNFCKNISHYKWNLNQNTKFHWNLIWWKNSPLDKILCHSHLFLLKILTIYAYQEILPQPCLSGDLYCPHQTWDQTLCLSLEQYELQHQCQLHLPEWLHQLESQMTLSACRALWDLHLPREMKIYQRQSNRILEENHTPFFPAA